MALVVMLSGWNADEWAARLKDLAPQRDIRTWADPGRLEDIRYALVWQPPLGALATLPKLEVIFSLGAGVDHILRDPQLPDVPIVRGVNENLTMRMTEYVVLHVLMHHRRQREYDRFQARGEWKELAQPAAAEVRVGIMGMGVLGSDAARKLADLGFQVAGWSQSAKQIDGVESFAGADRLDAFLERTDILVSLLPATEATRGLIDARLLSRLAKNGALPGPVLINAGRGAVQVERDILAALDNGDLHAATLDVFETEPLPADSPLWRHPQVTITPHNASISDPLALSRAIVEQIARFEQGEALDNVVDTARAY